MSIIEQAKTELALINFGEDDSRVMIEILEKFFDQWDSGGAVSAVAPVLQRLIAGQPLSPLTGADDEWFIHDIEGMYAQNKRCGSVFKATKDGPAYDTDVRGRPNITFPYWPTNSEVRPPVFEVERPQSIAELDTILNSESDEDVTVNFDGSVTRTGKVT